MCVAMSNQILGRIGRQNHQHLLTEWISWAWGIKATQETGQVDSPFTETRETMDEADLWGSRRWSGIQI